MLKTCLQIGAGVVGMTASFAYCSKPSNTSFISATVPMEFPPVSKLILEELVQIDDYVFFKHAHSSNLGIIKINYIGAFTHWYNMNKE